ncbi:MAG TPA: restriction endonuclease subunit S [Candidatus Krumholzibacteria bacterium]|nr:restriction endonuclease subunit S [Candidatus Krumholzibacteria bacterium]HRY42051.1 restriction endonuclease subunit S [Candidatus Krumholzibacteria bacterium]
MSIRIKDLAEIQIGYQFRQGFDANPFGTHLVVQVRDIDEQSNHRLVSAQLARTNLKGDPSRYLVYNGDVLFLSKGRRHSATLVEGLPKGRGAIAAGYFFILRPDAGRVRPDFLSWTINGPQCKAYLQSVARGSGMPFVPKDAFANMTIDLPDLTTQSRIVQLNDLAERESALLERLRTKRTELIHGICTNAARETGRQAKE